MSQYRVTYKGGPRYADGDGETVFPRERAEEIARRIGGTVEQVYLTADGAEITRGLKVFVPQLSMWGTITNRLAPDPGWFWVKPDDGGRSIPCDGPRMTTKGP